MQDPQGFQVFKQEFSQEVFTFCIFHKILVARWSVTFCKYILILQGLDLIAW